MPDHRTLIQQHSHMSDEQLRYYRDGWQKDYDKLQKELAWTAPRLKMIKTLLANREHNRRRKAARNDGTP